MAKTSLMFFKEDCMGCHACEVACKQEHSLGVGPRLVQVLENSSDFIPIFCHHCANAPCRDACPTEAIYKDENGIVLINNDECIGCQACVESCPFGAMQFDEKTEFAIKCDLCVDKLKKGERTACSKACPTQCIFVGDTRQLSERVIQERA
ncbi:MAG: 4Fe-4S binding protein [Desulfobacula sp.]|nr:4Fe-4S binding protein [Desulfobacula sp.]